MGFKNIDPLTEFGSDLISIEKPSRYLGGEMGSHPPIPVGDERLRIVLCFPDLYEIGMSNNAIRILYSDIGERSERLACERVFAPAPDFERLLRNRGLPLCSLESGIILRDFDILGFSLSYELLATNILTVLDLGGIHIEAERRGEEEPIVIAGGPAATNPLPLSRFLDAVYIGEAEAGFYDVLLDMASIKDGGGTRQDLLDRLKSCRAVWMPARIGSAEKAAYRAVFSGFTEKKARVYFPIPSLQTVQSHGTVEIMRGCPNGCRFCHAGYFYRPQRIKDPLVIGSEIEDLVNLGGNREITLSSLSSGDYPGIAELFHALNEAWADRRISFQLPSLKVDSFTLPLVAELAEVRKSGLTFAIETPVEDWQRSINKSVDFDKVIEILKEAKRYGFRSAKFYFMIGLPLPGRGRGEGQAIIDFLKKIAAVERIALNINIGTFVPKAHTPYQRQAQIGEKEALETIYLIKDALRPYRSISVSYHSPYTSVLEGILSRGDERVGDIIFGAWRKGARFDAWDEYFNKEAWKDAIEEAGEKAGYNPAEWFLSKKPADFQLPWQCIHLFVNDAFLEKEEIRSEAQTMTTSCNENCDHPCGSCNDSFGIVSNTATKEVKFEARRPNAIGYTVLGTSKDHQEDRRLLVSYEKLRSAAFLPMHSFSNLFARAFTILGLPIRFSEGFNPLPKMEFTQPLSLGIESEEELLALWLDHTIEITEEKALLDAFSKALPEDIRVKTARLGLRRSEGKNSIGSLYWGSEYRVVFKDKETASKFLAAVAARKPSVVVSPALDLLFNVVLAEAKDGDGSISKLLKQALETDNLLTVCSVTRTRLLGKRGDGPCEPLITML
ncbi:MAG: TIGR03960 family B12-binding radical SAM protein [Spirochaetes bacterium]|nr:TIGR03960 family B12-binding radical SAM protein [Spirochaetota bacterium]